MDQIVFHLYLSQQPKNTERFLIQSYLLKRKTFEDMLKRFEDTEYARVLFPALVVHTDQNERVETLMTVMLDNRKFVKNTAQKKKRSKHAALI
jgi:hypothetical protein